MKKLHPYRESYLLLPTVYTRTYVYFINNIVSSIAYGQPINVWQEIFQQPVEILFRQTYLYNSYPNLPQKIQPSFFSPLMSRRPSLMTIFRRTLISRTRANRRSETRTCTGRSHRLHPPTCCTRPHVQDIARHGMCVLIILYIYCMLKEDSPAYILTSRMMCDNNTWVRNRYISTTSL